MTKKIKEKGIKGYSGSKKQQKRWKDKVRKRLSTSRFEHSLRVACYAQSLAYIYGVDPENAYLAGLIHDWDKKYNNEEICCRARELHLTLDALACEEVPLVLHGMTAAAALAQNHPELPVDVISAIKVHTTGAIAMSDLDMVLYCADALEPGRSYPGVAKLRALVGSVDLEQVFFSTFEHTLCYLLKSAQKIYPSTFLIWNYYVGRAQQRREALHTKKEDIGE